MKFSLLYEELKTSNDYVIGSHIGTGVGSVYAPNSKIPYTNLEGVKAPGLKSNEVYLVRFSTEDETKSPDGVGHYAYAGKNLDDIIASTEAFTTRSKGSTGWLLIGKVEVDEEWDVTPEEEASGYEMNQLLGTEYAPVILSIPVSKRIL